ncbi:MAG: 30S ribosomal protein S6 [Kiritimatiellaeota bacterium]|nr:30S ribosomal protein S6 [Kiritimatiellota bacterium]
MNRYEAMFIFREDLKEEGLEEVLNKVRAEIKKVGGEVDSTTRMGRRAFARTMQKKTGGQYVIVVFRCAGSQITALLAKYKLNEDVFRVQILRAAEPTAAAPAEAPEKR